MAATTTRRFDWTGRAGGRPVAGALDAADAPACAAQLSARGIVPLTIRPSDAAARPSPSGAAARPSMAAAPASSATAAASASAAPAAPGDGAAALALPAWLRRPARVQPLERQLFARQMHTLLRSGVPLLRALVGLQDSAPSAALREAIAELRAKLGAGHELSRAMAMQPRTFGAFTVAMVRVGESTGRLDEVFRLLAEHEEFDASMRQKVKSALRYPIFVIAAMVAALVVINVLVLPVFAQVFASFNATLPWPTRALLAGSAFTLRWGGAIALGAVAAGVALRAWVGRPAGRLAWDRQALRWPVAGALVRQATLARFARSFAMAIKSGVPIGASMTMVAQTVDNAWVARQVEAMRDSLERGESLTRSAAASGQFTPLVLQMIGVGEETGAIDEMLGEVAKLYAAEVEHELRMLAQNIEPILIVALGVMVLVLALGVFLPLWDLGRVAIKN